MTMPIEIKLMLERMVIERAVTIMGVHSWVVDGNTVHVIYDITPDPAGNGLHFEFSFPARITRDELRRFAEWLASSGYAGMTVH
jgi:hypothetical protein